MTDFHSHILPFMDDGAADTDTSVAMLRRLRDQGVTRVFLTPHYYPGEESTAEFLSRRDRSFAHLTAALPEGETFPALEVGAEIAVCRGISETDLSALALGNTGAILLELPGERMTSQLFRELSACSASKMLVPVIAHLDRYVWLSQAEIERLSDIPDAVFQVNCDALSSFPGRRLVHRFIKKGRRILFGSDAHNMAKRSPRFDLVNEVLSRHGGDRLAEVLYRGERFVLNANARFHDTGLI